MIKEIIMKYKDNGTNEIPLENIIEIGQEVVRCKECRHNPKFTKDYQYGLCPYCQEDDYYAGTPDDEHFCSYGERNE